MVSGEIKKKNGVNFSLTITLRDIIWTLIFIITLVVTYNTLVVDFGYHHKDTVRHLTQEERQANVRIQTQTEEHLKSIDEKLNQLIKMHNK